MLPPLVALVPLSRLLPLVGRLGSAPDADDAELDGYVHRLLLALPAPWRYTCLRRSVVLYHLLRRAGRGVTLQVGVRRQAGREGSALEAHAWLELDGRRYLEPAANAADTYRVIATFPEAPAGA